MNNKHCFIEVMNIITSCSVPHYITLAYIILRKEEVGVWDNFGTLMNSSNWNRLSRISIVSNNAHAHTYIHTSAVLII